MRGNSMFGGLRNSAQQVPPLEEEVKQVAREEKEALRKETSQVEVPELTQEERMMQFLQEEHKIPPQQVMNWKREHGHIYMLAFDDDEIYIYRAIRAIEFNNLMLRLRNVANVSDDAADTELVRLCLLHPKLDPVAYNSQPAGWLSSLRLAIQRSSRFYSEEELSRITFKL